MAGDWIKMRTDLYRDPKVCAIADNLMNQDGELAGYVNQNCQRNMTVTRNVMRNVTVGALVSVWGVMRLRGKRINDDLVFKSGTLWIIDDLAELPGFGKAMADVGWVVADEAGIVFPNFFSEYNVDPNEDANAKNAERQRRYREKTKLKSNVTDDVTNASQSNAREEKRREDIDGDKSPSKRAAKKCPDSFQVPEDQLTKMTEECPLVDIQAQTKLFRDHTFSVAKTDWVATWRNWMRTKQERLVEAAGKVQALESFKQTDARIGRERWEEMTGEQHPQNVTPQSSNILNVIDVTPVQRIGAAA